jgi:hypothetical protein
MKFLKKVFIIIIFLVVYIIIYTRLPTDFVNKHWFITLLPVIIFFLIDTGIIKSLMSLKNIKMDKENLDSSRNNNKNPIKIFSIIIVVVFVSFIFSLDKNKSNSSSNPSTYGTNKNVNRGDHISYVRNNFQSSGKDVYNISIVGNNGENGYLIYVNGYDRQRGFSFDCNVKTDGTNGIVITDTGFNVRTQY